MTDTHQLPALPLGASDFETLRQSEQIYVDKTALICRLASLRQKFFLTRPRHFGKSLLVSTFASLFRNGLKHFSGLAIEKLWKDTRYKVVEIDFSEIKNFTSLEIFEKRLDGLLITSFAPFGFRPEDSERVDIIQQLSSWLKTQTCCSLVLLIDEYDAPQTACLEDKELFKAVRTLLSNFFSIVKSNDACWRFVFMTGIAKFNQTGIFSELNNFTDISLNPLFASLLGYTEEDIDQYFSGYVQEAAKALNLPAEDIRRQLRENYDGYCFDEAVSCHLYAPWSVLQFFSWPTLGFKNYWMESGGRLTFLQKYLHSHALRSPEDYATEKNVFFDDLSASSDFDDINDVVLLTQAGYLTIKRRDEEVFYVNYPDREVTDSLGILYRRLLLKQKTLSEVGAGGLMSAVRAGNVDFLFDQANHAFAAVDYSQYPITNEGHCQTCLQLLLSGFGFSVTAQRHGALGRSDLEVEAPKVHWVFELKYQRKGESAETLLAKAIEQIKAKQYGASSVKPVIRVSAVFSEEKRQFICWQKIDSP